MVAAPQGRRPGGIARETRCKGIRPWFSPEDSHEPMRSREVDGASGLGGGAPSPVCNVRGRRSRPPNDVVALSGPSQAAVGPRRH